MATFYSEHYSARIGQTGHFTTRSTLSPILGAGEKHGRLRRTAARCMVPIGDLGNGDVIRFLDLKSGDRPVQILFSMDADWGATATFHIGFYRKGAFDDGAAIDLDLFSVGAADDWAGAILREDLFTQGSAILNMDRGKTAWELAVIGGAVSYTEDPKEIWTLAATASADPSANVAAVYMLAELIYMAGD